MHIDICKEIAHLLHSLCFKSIGPVMQFSLWNKWLWLLKTVHAVCLLNPLNQYWKSTLQSHVVGFYWNPLWWYTEARTGKRLFPFQYFWRGAWGKTARRELGVSGHMNKRSCDLHFKQCKQATNMHIEKKKSRSLKDPKRSPVHLLITAIMQISQSCGASAKRKSVQIKIFSVISATLWHGRWRQVGRFEFFRNSWDFHKSNLI